MKSLNDEIKADVILEIKLMKALGLSYSELQTIPLYVIKIWIDEYNKEQKKIMLERNKETSDNGKWNSFVGSSIARLFNLCCGGDR